jgi:hypothetical protein
MTGRDYHPEFVLNAMGGISNCYCYHAMKAGGKIEFETYHTFCSPFFTDEHLIQETRNCTGFKLDVAVTLLDCMEQVIKDIIQSRGISKLETGPWGTLEVINLDKSEFKIYYEDPAYKDYDKFLLGVERD